MCSYKEMENNDNLCSQTEFPVIMYEKVGLHTDKLKSNQAQALANWHKSVITNDCLAIYIGNHTDFFFSYGLSIICIINLLFCVFLFFLLRHNRIQMSCQFTDY